MATSVVLVDDSPEVRRLVRTALRFHGGFDVVGEAGDGTDAVRVVTTTQPDILVLDLGLPDIAGRDVLTQVREHSPRTRIVVFSGATADHPDRQWLKNRVEGYALKDSDLDYLVNLLTAVADCRDVAVRDFPRTLSAARDARAFLRCVLSRWDAPGIENDAQVVISELVTNAVVHAKSDCTVRLKRLPTTVRIEVVDAGGGAPDPKQPTPGGEGGRGMHIITTLCTAWGAEPMLSGGKVVWAELHAPTAAAADHSTATLDTAGLGPVDSADLTALAASDDVVATLDDAATAALDAPVISDPGPDAAPHDAAGSTDGAYLSA